MRARRALWLVILFGAPLLSACSQTREYTVKVVDPRAVTIEGIDTPARPSDPAPTVASRDVGSKPWSASLTREADGGLRLRCRACDRDGILIGGDGLMRETSDLPPGVLGLVRPTPEEVALGALVNVPYSFCGSPRKHGCGDSAWNGRRVTRWSNVAEVRVREGPASAGSPLILGASIFAGAGGTFFLVEGLRSGPPAASVAGTAAGVVGLAFAAALAKMFIEGHIEHVIDNGAATVTDQGQP
jgi:hypothetical protein